MYHLLVTREAVQHDVLGPLLRQGAQGVGPRLPDVYDERLATLPRQRDVGAENSLLILLWRKPPVIVETCLSDPDHQRVGQEFLDHRTRPPVELGRRVGVDA